MACTSWLLSFVVAILAFDESISARIGHRSIGTVTNSKRPKGRSANQAYNYGGNYNYDQGGPRPGANHVYNPGLVDARGRNLNDIDWSKIWEKLPSERDPAAYKKRTTLWNKIDVNGNGYLSLAEVDKGIRDVLNLDAVFDCKPAIMRAFQAAKQSNGKTVGYSGDFVERNEFRALMEYLRKYFELYVMFRHIDSNFDRRVSLQEFKAALSKLEQWGVRVSNADRTFKEIDVDGGGMILFDEFAAWAILQSLTLGPDGPGGQGLQSAEGPSNSNYVYRPPAHIQPAVSLSLNGADPHARSRLIKFYQHYAPEKLSEVDSILQKFRGKEHLLFPMLVQKYGPEPSNQQHGNNFRGI